MNRTQHADTHAHRTSIRKADSQAAMHFVLHSAHIFYYLNTNTKSALLPVSNDSIQFLNMFVK